MAVNPREVFSKLGQLAPSISFDVEWDEDPYFPWDGDGPDPADEGMVAHDVIVYARAIVAGRMIEGERSLGGVYELPGKRDPEIHGYLYQMLEEAVEELAHQSGPAVSGPVPRGLKQQAARAQRYLQEVMRRNRR
jgi:hypothetical protein